MTEDGFNIEKCDNFVLSGIALKGQILDINYNELFNKLKLQKNVKARYKRANSKFLFNKSASSSQLFVEAFAITDISDSNWGKKISETLIKTNKQLQNIDKSIKKIGSSKN